MRTDSEQQKLWFDAVSARLHLRFSVGVLLLGVLPVLATILVFYVLTLPTDFGGNLAVSIPLSMLSAAFLLYASHYINIRVERLRQYSESMNSVGPVKTAGEFHSLKGVVVAWVILIVAAVIFFEPLFTPGVTFEQGVVRELLSVYIRFLQATFLWVFGSSMYALYRFGRLPLQLKSYTQDRTLGLKPFAVASLHFTTLYVIAVFLTFPIFLGLTFPGVVSSAIFLVLDLILFLIPLFSLRGKLVSAKRAKLDWINERHSRVMRKIEATAEGPIDAGLVNELLAIDKIQRDLHGIRHWPFDYGIVAQLATVVVAPLGVVLFATYLVHVLRI